MCYLVLVGVVRCFIGISCTESTEGGRKTVVVVSERSNMSGRAGVCVCVCEFVGIR